MMDFSAEQIAELNNILKSVYQEVADYRNKERKVLFNVDSLYEQIRFLRENSERWAFIITKDDKIQRIEATTEDNEGDSLV